MSLDVYLYYRRPEPTEHRRALKLLRAYGFEEYADHIERHFDCREEDEVYWANYTHNVNNMARKAGFYQAVWRPEECGIERAEQLIEPLRRGIAVMESDPEKFRAMNPPNGWGDYDRFVIWLKKYLCACEDHPQALVRVSR